MYLFNFDLSNLLNNIQSAKKVQLEKFIKREENFRGFSLQIKKLC